MGSVFFDNVFNVEFISEKNKYVYDLTVEKTRNFQLFNGLNVRDTLKYRVSDIKNIASL